MQAIVGQLAVDFVGHDPGVVLGGFLSNVFQISQRDDATSGVARGVQNDQAGFVRDAGVEGRQIEGELVLFPQRDGNGNPAGHPDHGFVGGEAGVRVEHFVARVYQRQGGEEKPGLGTRPDDDARG